jgi:hypothetical protein
MKRRGGLLCVVITHVCSFSVSALAALPFYVCWLHAGNPSYCSSLVGPRMGVSLVDTPRHIPRRAPSPPVE